MRVSFLGFRLIFANAVDGLHENNIERMREAPTRGTYSAVDLGHGENGGVGVFGREIVGVVGRGSV